MKMKNEEQRMTLQNVENNFEKLLKSILENVALAKHGNVKAAQRARIESIKLAKLGITYRKISIAKAHERKKMRAPGCIKGERKYYCGWLDQVPNAAPNVVSMKYTIRVPAMIKKQMKRIVQSFETLQNWITDAENQDGECQPA